MNLSSYMSLVAEKLDSSGIRYAVVGGCAKSIYKENISTQDLDILIDDSSDNLLRFQSFMEMHFNRKMTIEELRNADLVKICAKPYSIDFHFNLDGVSNEVIFQEIQYRIINGIKIQFIAENHLINNLKTVAELYGIHE